MVIIDDREIEEEIRKVDKYNKKIAEENAYNEGFQDGKDEAEEDRNEEE